MAILLMWNMATTYDISIVIKCNLLIANTLNPRRLSDQIAHHKLV